MSIEPEAQKDLALDDEAAENVVGGVRKKKTKKRPGAKPEVILTPPGSNPEGTPPPDPAQWGDEFAGMTDIGF